MSARERLAEALRNPGLVGLDEDGAAELIDAFAHELAEQQREFVRRQARNVFHYGSAQWAIKGVDEAADHIDPQTRPASSEETTP